MSFECFFSVFLCAWFSLLWPGQPFVSVCTVASSLFLPSPSFLPVSCLNNQIHTFLISSWALHYLKRQSFRQIFIFFPSDSDQNIYSGLSGAVFIRFENVWPLVRIYRGGFLLIQFIFLLGINTYGWRQAGVNHVLIFEINPRNNLSHQHLFEVRMGKQIETVYFNE